MTNAYQSQSPATNASSTVSTANGVQAFPLTQAQIEILESRGINLEIAAKMGLRAVKSKDIINKIPLLQFPYFRNGIEVNCRTRTISGKKEFHQTKGGEQCFYNIDILKDIGDGILVITEGEFDCLIALQCGFNAVSVPNGAPAQKVRNDENSTKYDYLIDFPKEIKEVIIASDSDSAGLNLLHDLGLRLGKHRCKWIEYPKDCKDLNDIYTKFGEIKVKEILNNAKFMKIEGLWKLSDMPPLPTHEALSVGIDLLEPHFKMRAGDFSVFTGIPSHGKTTLANQIAFNMAWKHGWNVCFASFEQNPQLEHRRALRTLYTQKPEWQQTQQELDSADRFIDKRFSFIVPTDDLNESSDLQWLIDRMTAAVVRFEAKLIVIDPWNELDHAYDSRSQTITQYVGMAIKNLKRFAQKNLVHVMVIAHPAKMQRNKDGSYPVPTPYDISDSSHWYNKPEQIVIVHRKSDEITLARVAKSRYHQILGTPAEVELKFNSHNFQFENPN